jgi:hypothetical protein
MAGPNCFSTSDEGMLPLRKPGKAHVARELRRHALADALDALSRHGHREAAAPRLGLLDVDAKVGRSSLCGHSVLLSGKRLNTATMEKRPGPAPPLAGGGARAVLDAR